MVTMVAHCGAQQQWAYHPLAAHRTSASPSVTTARSWTLNGHPWLQESEFCAGPASSFDQHQLACARDTGQYPPTATVYSPCQQSGSCQCAVTTVRWFPRKYKGCFCKQRVLVAIHVYPRTISAAPKSCSRTTGRFCWYEILSLSSSVLEHTMRPSPEVTTMPPQLQPSTTILGSLGSPGLYATGMKVVG